MAMRVTDSMITMHSQNNINGVKSLVDKYNNQMTDHKKISKPSDDPVVAIRSLRLRSTLNDVNQYYEKNIPDAQSWLEQTDTSLNNMKEILKDIYTQCVNGANDTLTAEDRETLTKNITSLKDQLYSEGNGDYAGRTIFTGYKTNKTLTFESNDSSASYEITQKLTADSITEKRYYSDSLNVPVDATTGCSNDMSEVTNSRIRLAYEGLDGTKTVNFSYTANGTTTTPTITTKPYDDWEADGFAVGADEVLFIPETGELVLGSNVSTEIKTASASKDFAMSVSYSKTGFEEGDVRPEMYFDCTDVTSAANPISYTKETQNIEYGVSTNQYLAVNIQASDDGILSTSIGRELEELLDAVGTATNAAAKVTKIKAMLANTEYSDETSQANLNEWLTAAEKEATYADDNLQKLFKSAQPLIQEAQTAVNLADTEVGSRMDRLKLTKTRMSSQQTTVKSLLSENEDRAASDILIDYKSAYTAYESALSAASKANQMTLLDYL